MDPRGGFVAEKIEAGLKSLAAGAVLRQTAPAGDDSPPPAAGEGFATLVQETEVRLRYLAQAVAAARPELLADHVRWARAAYEARGVPTELLEANLRAMQAELCDALDAADAERVRDALTAGLEAARRAPAPPPSLVSDVGPGADLARRFLLALLEGRRADALALALDAQGRGLGIAQLHDEVVTRAQAEVGRLWQLGEIGVVEEHLGSRIVEDVLAALRQRLPEPAPDAPRVLVAGISGELHDIGARMVADRLTLAGWNALFLGANTPAPDLLEAVRETRPDLLALSLSLALHVRATADLIAAVRAAFGSDAPPILVGGAPFAAVPDLWRVLGADAGATSAAEAVAFASRLAAR
jgi:methanogenic corrinoid protein MtbC1